MIIYCKVAAADNTRKILSGGQDAWQIFMLITSTYLHSIAIIHKRMIMIANIITTCSRELAEFTSCKQSIVKTKPFKLCQNVSTGYFYKLVTKIRPGAITNSRLMFLRVLSLFPIHTRFFNQSCTVMVPFKVRSNSGGGRGREFLHRTRAKIYLLY